MPKKRITASVGHMFFPYFKYWSKVKLVTSPIDNTGNRRVEYDFAIIIFSLGKWL